MNSALPMSSLVIALVPGWLVYIVMYAATIKILERRLTFTQSLLMSAIATAVSLALLVIFHLSEAAFDALHSASARSEDWQFSSATSLIHSSLRPEGSVIQITVL